MRLTRKNYEILNNKIKNSISICLLSDIHFGEAVKKKNLDMIIKDIRDNNPDYICISGDYIDCINVLENEKLFKDSIDYLDKLAKITKVIYTFGNHDVTKLYGKKKHFYSFPDKWVDEVKKIPNLVFLYNDIYIDKNIRFIGYVADERYYYNEHKNQDILIDDYQNKIPVIDNTLFNVLLFHSPIQIFRDNIFSSILELKKIDLILSGHMHNGLVPNLVDKLWKSNRGFISPLKTFFPNYSRGIQTKKINNTSISLIVSGGVTKIHSLVPKIFRLINIMYKPEINYITIKASD